MDVSFTEMGMTVERSRLEWGKKGKEKFSFGYTMVGDAYWTLIKMLIRYLST